MADTSTHLDEAVERLERALEKIACVTSEIHILWTENTDKTSGAEAQVQEVAKQLDILIDRLRAKVFS